MGPNIDSVHRIEHLANIDHVRECRKGLIMGDVIKLLFNYLFLLFIYKKKDEIFYQGTDSTEQSALRSSAVPPPNVIIGYYPLQFGVDPATNSLSRALWKVSIFVR